MLSLVLSKVFGVVVFLTFVAFFGNFFSSVIDALQKAKTRRFRYFSSTMSLLMAFVIFKLLNRIFELFVR